MRKIAIIFVITFTTLSYSQEKFGVIGGVNASQVSNGFFGGLDTFGIGFHFGAVYNIEITKNISFSPKLIYSQQGDRIKTSKTSSNGAWIFGGSNNGLDYKLSYINIPLNFKFFKKTYILLGPQVGVLLDTKKMDLDFGEVENKIDFGINLGIGQKINSFFIEFNINQGFSTLITHKRNKEANYYIDDFNAKNLVLQLSLGYYIK